MMTPLRQKLIEEIVEEFRKRFPQEYEDASKSAKAMQGTRANVYGSDEQKELRLALRLPNRLAYALQMTLQNPTFLKEDDEFNWFMKRFPEFRVPEKI